MDANSKSYRFAGCLRRKSDLLAAIAAALLAATWSVIPADAQQNDVSLSIDVVSWGNEIGGLSFKTDSKDGQITALPFQYSKPVPYSGPAIMEIYKSGNGPTKDQPEMPEMTEADIRQLPMPLIPEKPAPGTNEDAPPKQGIALELEKRRKLEPSLVALAALPAGCRRATVLLAPAMDGTFTAYVINDDPSKLPVGQLRIHNLSPFTIAMRLNGAAPKELKTREATAVQASNEQVIYDLAYQVEDKWKVQEHNIIPVRPNEQTQMIVLRSDNQFFTSSDGSTGGFLQAVTLRRAVGQ